MFGILEQRNIYESFGFDPSIGPYISTIMHDRKFVQESYGPTVEVPPCMPFTWRPGHTPHFEQNWYPAGKTTQTSPGCFQSQFSPEPQNSAKPASPRPTSPKQPSHREPVPPGHPHYIPGVSQEELDELRKEAGWYPGCEDEEKEEEPDFWDFFRQLSKDTDERIRQTQQEYVEENENYFVARFDFH